MKILGGIFKTALNNNKATVDLSGTGASDTEEIEVLRLEPYAIYAKPLRNSKTTMLCSGNRIFSISDTGSGTPPSLDYGDIAIDTGNIRMHFKHAQRTIEVTGATNISLGTGAQALVTEQIISWLNNHTHPAPGGATLQPAMPVTTAILTKTVKGG